MGNERILKVLQSYIKSGINACCGYTLEAGASSITITNTVTNHTTLVPIGSKFYSDEVMGLVRKSHIKLLNKR